MFLRFLYFRIQIRRELWHCSTRAFLCTVIALREHLPSCLEHEAFYCRHSILERLIACSCHLSEKMIETRQQSATRLFQCKGVNVVVEAQGPCFYYSRLPKRSKLDSLKYEVCTLGWDNTNVQMILAFQTCRQYFYSGASLKRPKSAAVVAN